MKWPVLDRSPSRLSLEEIVINTWTFDPEARRRSYALPADALQLRLAEPSS